MEIGKNAFIKFVLALPISIIFFYLLDAKLNHADAFKFIDTALIIACPIAFFGLIRLKNWGRFLSILISTAIVIYFFCITVLSFTNAEAFAWLELFIIISIPLLIPAIFILFYFNKLKVKELFIHKSK